MFRPLLLVALIATGTVAHASIDDGDTTETMGYDAIVDQLNKEHSQQAAQIRARQPVVHDESSLDSVWMHGGLGFSNFIESIKFDDGTNAVLNQKGIQAALGIDLFSPNWMAEGTARAFAEDGDNQVRASVKEFELKVLFKDHLTALFGYHGGLGLTGRYLTIERAGIGEVSYTTPTSVATLGGDLFVNEKLSLGIDLNARNALIGETIDHNSFDMTLRVDTHF